MTALKTTGIVIFWVITSLLFLLLLVVMATVLGDKSRNDRQMEIIERSSANTTCEAVRDGLTLDQIVTITADAYKLSEYEAMDKVMNQIADTCPQYL